MNKEIGKKILVIMLIGGLLAWRAWFRILDPQVWSEDGNQNLFNLLEHGYHSIFFPVNGYLILIPKLISALSLSISIYYYPQISTIITFVVTIYILYEIYRSRIIIPGKLLLTICTILIPTDTECFGLPLYTFWWASLLIFLCLLWQDEREYYVRRLIWIIMSGLSSPVIIISLPVFYYRIIKFKNKACDSMLALTASITAVIQILVILIYASVENSSQRRLLSSLSEIIQKYIGEYFYGNDLDQPSSYILLAAAISFLITLAVSLFKAKEKYPCVVLMYLLFANILISTIRVDISFQHPVHAGQRYFFFPYIIISWCLVYILLSFKRSYILQGVAICGLIAGIYNMCSVINRVHEHIDWQTNILSCTKFSHYNMPIHSSGALKQMWILPIDGKKCADALNKDILFNATHKNVTGTYPYRWTEKFQASDVNTTQSQMPSISWTGKDYFQSKIDELIIHGSYITGNDDVVEQFLNLKKGDKLLFRSDASNNTQQIFIKDHEEIFSHTIPIREGWILLDFSNKELPAEFTVIFRDNGQGPGDWSAIAVR